MASSVTRWFSNFGSSSTRPAQWKTDNNNQPPQNQTPGHSEDPLAKTSRTGLSAQSTLESLALHPGMNSRAAQQAPRRNSPSSLSGSPSSIATLSSSSQGGALSSLTSETASPFAGAPQSIAAATSASLGPLFACISPYLSPADVKSNLPFRRLYETRGPVIFPYPPLEGINLPRGELRLWENEGERVVSQNSSNRRVHRALWVAANEPQYPRAAALKFVEDANPRDGRSLKREIECHEYVHQKLPGLFQLEQELRAAQTSMGLSFINNPEWSTPDRLEDAWPSAELFGFHLDKKNPGKSVLLTRKLSGPDLFDVIRAEHNHNWHFHHPSSRGSGLMHKCRTIYAHRTPTPKAATARVKPESVLRAAAAAASSSESCVYYPLNYEYHKLRWCALALKRIAQYAALSIRHNDVKPDNIVLDFYTSRSGHDVLDVKLIDLGTASMHNAKDFTGGTSWYESPEQKLLEYFMKKRKRPEAAKRVDIDLQSDLWGAGISLAEVLVGRRVVDTLKTPHGPGSLEYLGYEAATTRGQGRMGVEEMGSLSGDVDCNNGGGHLGNYPYWAVDPEDWVTCARKALNVDKEGQSEKITIEAAKWIFNHLVRPSPETRTSLTVAMSKMERFAEEAYRRYRHVSNSFDRFNGPQPSLLGLNPISPETTSASTPAMQAQMAGLGMPASFRQQMINVAGSKGSPLLKRNEKIPIRGPLHNGAPAHSGAWTERRVQDHTLCCNYGARPLPKYNP